MNPKPFSCLLRRVSRVLLSAILLAGPAPAIRAGNAALAGPRVEARQAPTGRWAEQEPPVAPVALAIAGPVEGELGVTYTFTASVTPLTATLPLTYTWEASGQAAVTHATIESATDSAGLTWTVAGEQTVTVTASNQAGTISATQAITLYAPPQAEVTPWPTASPASETAVPEPTPAASRPRYTSNSSTPTARRPMT